MDKDKKLSARADKSRMHAKRKKIPPPPQQSYSYYLSNSTYIDDKNKIEKHLEIKSNGNYKDGRYIEKKNGEIKIDLRDIDKVEKKLTFKY